MHEVTKVVPTTHHRLILTFENNETKVIDLSSELFGVFEYLKDPAFFNSVTLVRGAPTWHPPNGEMEIDLCPDALYTDSIPFEEVPA